MTDASALPKAQVRADADGPVAAALGVQVGTVRRAGGRLVVGVGPGRWLVVGDEDEGDLITRVASEVAAARGAEELASVIDLTHGRALYRLTGESTPRLLARLCALDLSPTAFADGAAARTAVAGVGTVVARDDRDGVASYLLACEASYGSYLLDELRCDVYRPL